MSSETPEVLAEERSEEFSDTDLAGYLDELLPAAQATIIENRLRESSALRQRLSGLIRRRDQGGHSIGEIWRRSRLSCPSRGDLGAYLLGVLAPGHADYIRFHIHTIGCRICEANLIDLEQSAKRADQTTEPRRQKFFESSAGRLGERR